MATTLTTPFPIQKSTITFGPDPIYGLFWDSFTPGVGASTDLQVVQHAAGANYSVDVSVGTGYVPTTQPLDLRRIRNTAVSNSVGSNADWATVFSAADATNPRIDGVIMLVNDANIDSSGLYSGQFKVLTGTPTPGATLANLSGKAALPANCILLAWVLIPALASTIPTANIRDGRSTAGTKGSGVFVDNDPAGTSTLPNTAFPSSPQDGNEISVLVDAAGTSPAAQGAAAALWTFRYSAAALAAGQPPWQFVGGASLTAQVSTAETTASASFVDLATVGPSIIVPRTGLYIVEFFARLQSNTASDGSAAAPTSPTMGGANNANSIRYDSPAAGSAARLGGFIAPVTLTKNEVLKLQYEVITGGTSTFSDRRIKLTPIAVS